MSYQSKIKRYLLIIQKTNKSFFPSISELTGYLLEHGIKISDRQLKRDFESLRDEFGMEIHYSPLQHGYYLKDEQLTFPYLMKILEFSQNAEILTEYLREGSNLFEIIEFEDFNTFKGIQFIKDLTIAIKNCSELQIRYKKFDCDQTKEYHFQPYLLREYLNRWYVIGTISGSNAIKTFGLDRIVDFKFTSASFTRDKLLNIPGIFNSIIGVQVNVNDTSEEIELSCHSYMGNLLKTLPLHVSQCIISESPEEIVFSYKMVINLELKQRLLMISNHAKVNKPQSLRAEIKNMLINSLDYYN